MSMKNYCATLEEAQMNYDFHLDVPRLSPNFPDTVNRKWLSGKAKRKMRTRCIPMINVVN